MRRLIERRLRDDRGATSVIVAVLMVPLIGCLAIALDVGALYVERGQLQNGADAAALAVAQDCAEDGRCDDPAGVAAGFASANANDGAADVMTPTFLDDHTVRVTTTTRDGASGAGALHHPFAALLGIESTTVRASATAEWVSLGKARVLPLAVSKCEFEGNRHGTGKLLIRYDMYMDSPVCEPHENHPVPGGFGWLKRPDGTCTVLVDLTTTKGNVDSEPGNSYPGACDSTMPTLEDQIVLVPVFDGARWADDAVKSYDVYGFAAFRLTGWKFAGSGYPQVNIDPTAPSCSGECRGIQGHFDHWVTLDQAEHVLGPNLGASIVRLTD